MSLLHKDTKPADDEQARLEKHVDAMMAPNAKLPTEPESQTSDVPAEPLDIFEGQQTPSAPPLPHHRAKAATSSGVAEANQAADTASANDDDSADDVKIPELKIDDAKSDAAIADIVAQESDAALAAEDASRQADQPAAPSRRGHPVFWFIIVLLVCLIGLAALMLTNPNVKLPFSQ